MTYPSLFVSVALDDDRVPPWNALKYVAKLRQQRSKKQVDPIANPLILRCRSTGGHARWNENQDTCEELAFLANLLDLEGAGRAVTDMDTMTQMTNLHSAGLIDADDAQKVFLKWAEWEHEMQDYERKLREMSFEQNYRVLSKKKGPYFWVPQADDITQVVADKMMEEADNERKQKTKRPGDEPGDRGRPVGENKYYKDVREGRKA